MIGERDKIEAGILGQLGIANQLARSGGFRHQLVAKLDTTAGLRHDTAPTEGFGVTRLSG